MQRDINCKAVNQRGQLFSASKESKLWVGALLEKEKKIGFSEFQRQHAEARVAQPAGDSLHIKVTTSIHCMSNMPVHSRRPRNNESGTV